MLRKNPSDPVGEDENAGSSTSHECCGCGHHHDHGHDHEHEHDDHEHRHDEHAHAAAALAALDQRFFFYVRVVILLLWGGVLLYFFTSGRITHYLTGTGTFRIQALIAGLLLCLIAVFNAVVSRKPAATMACADGCGHDHHGHDHHGDCDGHDGCGHDHHHHHGAPDTWVSRTVSIVVLCLPLTAAAIYTPDRYSDEFHRLKVAASATFQAPANAPAAQAFARKASAAAAAPDAPADGSPDAPTAAAAAAAGPSSNGFTVQDLERLSGGRSPEGNIKLQLVEVFYMPAQTPDVREVVASQTIEAIGQAIKDPAAPAGTTRLKLFRMQMTCCAADARPLAVPLEFDGPLPEYREMGWYKVTGKVEYRDENGTSTAVIKATKLETEKPPRNQMLF